MLTLHAGESSLVLAPEHGGAIVGWTLGAIPLMRRPQPDAIVPGNVRGLACFPMVPFSNRIARGRFLWEGSESALQHNFGDQPHCIHGIGWQSAWDVASVSERSAALTLRHDAAGVQAHRWPFAFSAEQHFTLADDALHVVLTMTNLHPRPAPAGFGLHPYFPRTGEPILRFRASGVWLNAPDMLPVRRIATPPEWDHAAGKPVGSASLDNCFDEWDGRARIVWPSGGRGITIEADDLFRHLIIYTPPGHDFFCVEPVSHRTNAINQSDADSPGMRVLAPGETLRGALTFRLTTSG
jgi:aldose 1-epimerase